MPGSDEDTAQLLERGDAGSDLCETVVPERAHPAVEGGALQLLVMTEEIERLAVTRATREEVEAKAMQQGMRTLWDDGLAKVAAGITSLEELSRVLV